MAGRDVVLCECFARDGLQHEPEFVATADKIALIDMFTTAGFARVEATSYSHPAQVPAFRDATEVLKGILRGRGVFYKATCPNLRAVRRALDDLAVNAGANELSLLVSATEAHTERNLRTTRAAQWEAVAAMAEASRGRARLVGVISMAFGCPFDGEVDPGRVAADAAQFAELGAEILTLGDTIGTATPRRVKEVFARVKAAAPDIIPVAHFHDTRGSGIANCLAALDVGCTYFDSAFGGVGGHPSQIEYGAGMTGNVATEDLVNIMEELGVSTGLDLERVMDASRQCEAVLGRQLESRVARSGFGLKAGKGRLWTSQQ